jgi:hypothetical protein
MAGRSTWPVVAAAVAAAGLGGCGGGTLDLGGDAFQPGWECTTRDAWLVRGFDYSHFSEAPPGELLTATVRRGEVVALALTNRVSAACDVVQVQWRSTSPGVATVTASGALGAELRGVAPGETSVSAEVTLADGSRQTAELHAVPSHGSPLLRVYAVRVVR